MNARRTAESAAKNAQNAAKSAQNANTTSSQTQNDFESWKKKYSE